MGCLKPAAQEEFFSRPVFSRHIQASEMIAEPETIFKLDMKTADEECLEVFVDFMCV